MNDYTLYELLKSNVKAKLEEASLTTPTTVKLITDALKTNYFVRDLTYGTVFDLQCIFDYSFEASPYDMFNDIKK
tara:strand:- start:172 stop:396 length:225 start_codon:yes stop_codon:yes gene_type:complete